MTKTLRNPNVSGVRKRNLIMGEYKIYAYKHFHKYGEDLNFFKRKSDKPQPSEKELIEAFKIPFLKHEKLVFDEDGNIDYEQSELNYEYEEFNILEIPEINQMTEV